MGPLPSGAARPRFLPNTWSRFRGARVSKCSSSGARQFRAASFALWLFQERLAEPGVLLFGIGPVGMIFRETSPVDSERLPVKEIGFRRAMCSLLDPRSHYKQPG